jgi:hypothetical protein
LPRIDHTEVIDNRTIAFYLRGGDILLNRLSRACSGLEDEQRFSHRTTGNQLCSADLITVLHSFAGGLTPGASCPLTMFEPTNEDVIAMLKGEDEDRGEVTVTEIEVDAEAQAEAEARARARARAEEE